MGGRARGMLGTFWRRATQPVSSASLAFLRIAFGIAMVINTALYLPVLVREYYVDAAVHFPYGPLTFVRPLPGPGIYLVYVGMAATGALIALGLWYRVAAWAFFVLTTYVFLLDSTYYQNHEYLISLLALLLAVLPVHGRWSMDARRRPSLRSDTVPAWMVWLLRFQIGVPYFFGGVAKLNADWLRGEPLRSWLAARTDIEPIASVLRDGNVVWFMTYGALALDLLVVALLLHRRTRVPAFAVATAFHLMNVWLFGLFIFPWLMIAATTVYFSPAWPERFHDRWWPRTEPRPAMRRSWETRPALAAVLSCWVLVQVLLPLRHLAIAGSPNWTEEGHRFAWHMKLRDKRGDVTFVLRDGDRTWTVHPSTDLTPKQLARLPGHPERLVHYARHLSKQHGGVEVRALTSVSLNGRPARPLVDPEIDLTTVRPPWRGGATWILPLEEPPGR